MRRTPYAACLWALLWSAPRLEAGGAVTPQALYRRAEAPVQVLWKDGMAWSWDGARLSLQSGPGVDVVPEESVHRVSVAGARVLGVSADTACLAGCSAELLRLALTAGEDPGAYLQSGHIQFEVTRRQALSGTLQVWYGREEARGRASIQLEAVKLGAYTHVSLPLAGFQGACAPGKRMTVPFGLRLKGARYNAGPMLAFKFIRWTPD